ncbi:hypothetical protein Dsin_030219 [Dipteronia sinensis]|uniref:Uncharacterized protein n=1 Tax=Dipteronia sinensis TaxID=43782 RepID=A0AAD9ZIJ4_9ROSI|nr:hypothetical protein Dsin_030219 [Dipteronia sinensis]
MPELTVLVLLVQQLLYMSLLPAKFTQEHGTESSPSFGKVKKASTGWSVLELTMRNFPSPHPAAPPTAPDGHQSALKNKVQVYRSVRMPQLHTSLHFHLTPIVMINGSSRRDLLLNSQNFCRSIPAGAENPSLSRLCYQRLWGSRNRRALILGWAYYLDAFSSYPLRTWLPSVYRGHDNWYTRGASFPIHLY